MSRMDQLRIGVDLGARSANYVRRNSEFAAKALKL